ncbi:MAG: hypothetical protein KA767_12195 [Saprospiraceae bacterium]|nr:hypothetical protein [Saprospiraceae bacterium]
MEINTVVQNQKKFTLCKMEASYFYEGKMIFNDVSMVKNITQTVSYLPNEKESISHPNYEKLIRECIKKSISNFKESNFESYVSNRDLSISITDNYDKNRTIFSLPEKEEIKFRNPQFAVTTVIDNRQQKGSIGSLLLSVGSNQTQEIFPSYFLDEMIKSHLHLIIQNERPYIPITLRVNKIGIHQKKINEYTKLFTGTEIDFLYGEEVLYTHTELNEGDKDEKIDIPFKFKNLLQNALIGFVTSDWKNKISDFDQKLTYNLEDLQSTKGSFKSEVNNFTNSADFKQPNSSLVALGYQLGGYSLIGFEREAMIDKRIGAFFGLGYLGATVGLKMHFKEDVYSNFISFSAKDGGIGKIDVLAIEFGGRLRLSKIKTFGIHYQAGFSYILNIDPLLASNIFDGETPTIFPSVGIGFSW